MQTQDAGSSTVPLLVSVAEAAAVLGLSEVAVWAHVRAGTFPPGVTVALGRRRFFHREKLRAFLESGGAPLPGGWRKQAVG